MDWTAWKTALGLYVSTPELIAASVVVGIAIFGFTWWLRGHIVKEQLELLRSQRADLDDKLTEGKAKITELERQIDNKVSSVFLAPNTAATSVIFDEMRIISGNMGVTLGPTSGAWAVVVPRRDSEER